MLKIRPETSVAPLKHGDEVITIAPSSIVQDEASLLKGIEILKGWGLKCRPQNISRRSWGYLAGNDDLRYRELHQTNSAPLTFCARGGWGAARLLEQPQHWKKGWLVGYSDISSLLLSRLSKGFDGGVHGPLLTSLYHEPEWSKERLRELLFGLSIPDLHGESWVKGIASGPLIVSNLTVGSHLLGSSHIPEIKGSILVLEDTNEEPYRIDRMLTHWRLAGLLQCLSGIAFGDFSQCNDQNQDQQSSTFSIEEILKERSSDLGIPVIGNLSVGHCRGNAALPMGRQVILDGNKGKLIVPSS